MNNETPEVSIVIVNWNARDLLRGCIRSIKEQTHRTFEIIIVDNASADGSAQIVEAEFPCVTLIANETNRGFAAANNQGIRISNGRYILLLNPDTIVLDGAIDRMVAWCDQHPDVGCAGCQVMEKPTVVQQTCFADPNPMNLLLVETVLYRVLPDLPFLSSPEYRGWGRNSEKEVDVVSGMFMLIPRAVLDGVGVLDEAFFVYGEEADLCRRIRAAGLRCVFAPIARILHLEGGGKSTSLIKPRMYVQLQKSMLIYNRKHNGLTGFAVVKSIFLVSKLIRWATFGLLALITRSAELAVRANLAKVSLLYHLLGLAPK